VPVDIPVSADIDESTRASPQGRWGEVPICPRVLRRGRRGSPPPSGRSGWVSRARGAP
jgi:hypothetical protein